MRFLFRMRFFFGPKICFFVFIFLYGAKAVHRCRCRWRQLDLGRRQPAHDAAASKKAACSKKAASAAASTGAATTATMARPRPGELQLEYHGEMSFTNGGKKPPAHQGFERRDRSSGRPGGTSATAATRGATPRMEKNLLLLQAKMVLNMAKLTKDPVVVNTSLASEMLLMLVNVG